MPLFLRGFYDYHTSSRKGWNDIAYNFVIDRFGGIWEARSGSLEGPVAGDATGGNQGYSQLCAIIGNFTDTMPSDESLDSLVALLAWLAERYQISTEPSAMTTFVSRGSNLWPEGTQITTPTIAGHRDMSRTACPGDTFYPYVTDHLMARVNQARQPPLSTTTTPPPTTVSRAPATTTTSLQSAQGTTPTTTAGSGSGIPTYPMVVGFGGVVAVVAVGAIAIRAARLRDRARG